eukprot:m.231712 g.231712  ORF g.231712 m.231712 type:complete len:584 (-) comp12257_c0_seq1:127-1878(-)
MSRRPTSMVVKARLGTELRRIPFHNEDLTYDDLLLMLQRVFGLSPSDELKLKYKDEDGDLVTLADSQDVSHAISQSPVLRIVISAASQASESGRTVAIDDIRHQLRTVCQSIEDLLDKLGKLDLPTTVSAPKTPAKTEEKAEARQTSKPTDRAVNALFDPVPSSPGVGPASQPARPPATPSATPAPPTPGPAAAAQGPGAPTPSQARPPVTPGQQPYPAAPPQARVPAPPALGVQSPSPATTPAQYGQYPPQQPPPTQQQQQQQAAALAAQKSSPGPRRPGRPAGSKSDKSGDGSAKPRRASVKGEGKVGRPRGSVNAPPLNTKLAVRTQALRQALRRALAEEADLEVSDDEGAKSRRGSSKKKKVYCVCRLPYDRAQLYVQCETCKDWFHPSCVGLPVDGCEKLDFNCPGCKTDYAASHSAPRICPVCNSGADPSLECAGCGGLFHMQCRPPAAGSLPSILSCPHCAQIVLSKPMLKSLGDILLDVSRMDEAEPFLMPVTPDIAPDYAATIAHPMDLRQMTSRLRGGRYASLGQFADDITLIVSNCRQFNGKDSEFTDMAASMEAAFITRLVQWRKALQDSA